MLHYEMREVWGVGYVLYRGPCEEKNVNHTVFVLGPRLRCIHTHIPPGTRTSWREDKAKDPLFTWVSEEALKRPTYRSFISLLDNYETSTGEAEVVTPEEVQENWTFINAITGTKVCNNRGNLFSSFLTIFLFPSPLPPSFPYLSSPPSPP